MEQVELDREVALVTWLPNAKRGERMEYWRGYLWADCHGTHDDAPVKGVRRTAWRLYQLGRVLLVQKRHGDEDYSYYAIATGGTKSPKVLPMPQRALRHKLKFA